MQIHKLTFFFLLLISSKSSIAQGPNSLNLRNILVRATIDLIKASENDKFLSLSLRETEDADSLNYVKYIKSIDYCRYLVNIFEIDTNKLKIGFSFTPLYRCYDISNERMREVYTEKTHFFNIGKYTIFVSFDKNVNLGVMQNWNMFNELNVGSMNEIKLKHKAGGTMNLPIGNSYFYYYKNGDEIIKSYIGKSTPKKLWGYSNFKYVSLKNSKFKNVKR